jgi:chromosome segregation ATPase
MVTELNLKKDHLELISNQLVKVSTSLQESTLQITSLNKERVLMFDHIKNLKEQLSKAANSTASGAANVAELNKKIQDMHAENQNLRTIIDKLDGFNQGMQA